jgi:hypothetical protein
VTLILRSQAANVVLIAGARYDILLTSHLHSQQQTHSDPHLLRGLAFEPLLCGMVNTDTRLCHSIDRWML